MVCRSCFYSILSLIRNLLGASTRHITTTWFIAAFPVIFFSPIYFASLVITSNCGREGVLHALLFTVFHFDCSRFFFITSSVVKWYSARGFVCCPLVHSFLLAARHISRCEVTFCVGFYDAFRITQFSLLLFMVSLVEEAHGWWLKEISLVLCFSAGQLRKSAIWGGTVILWYLKISIILLSSNIDDWRKLIHGKWFSVMCLDYLKFSSLLIT